uniref:ATP synthase F0 subunit 8 n=1 Tax=Epicrates crassus TaxID=996281 RepID=UPI00292A3EF3|nr:ATP synthase F0 subunit 8 [Epicrates crassus]WNK74784.1 ATP synthase F0 subunit 8 [Epicrates crassus]
MPQLDIVFISMTYVWTWTIFMMMTSKIKTVNLNNTPDIIMTEHNKTKQTLMLPWT